MTIFCEKEYAENLLQNGFKTFMSQRDLSILAKYFKYLGNSQSEIEKELIDFCYKHNPQFNEVLFSDKIETAIRASKKYNLKIFSDVEITEQEMEIIKSVDNWKYQKILFVMLAVSKYFGITDKGFFAKGCFSKFMKYAKVYYKKSERIIALNEINSMGLIDTTLYSSFKIKYVDSEKQSPVFIVITNMDKMIDFFPVYCQKCGKQIDRKIRKRYILCDSCKKEKNKELNRNRHR